MSSAGSSLVLLASRARCSARRKKTSSRWDRENHGADVDGVGEGERCRGSRREVAHANRPAGDDPLEGSLDGCERAVELGLADLQRRALDGDRLARQGGLCLGLGDLRSVTVGPVRRHGQAQLVQLVAGDDALASPLLAFELTGRLVEPQLRALQPGLGLVHGELEVALAVLGLAERDTGPSLRAASSSLGSSSMRGAPAETASPSSTPTEVTTPEIRGKTWICCSDSALTVVESARTISRWTSGAVRTLGAVARSRPSKVPAASPGVAPAPASTLHAHSSERNARGAMRRPPGPGLWLTLSARRRGGEGWLRSIMGEAPWVSGALGAGDPGRYLSG